MSQNCLGQLNCTVKRPELLFLFFFFNYLFFLSKVIKILLKYESA